MSRPVHIDDLPYGEDSSGLYAALRDEPWAVFLDSGRPGCSGGRWDIISARPRVTLTTRGALTEIRRDGRSELSPEDPFALLRRELGAPLAPLPGLPFSGGAIGWFGYDLGRRLERLPSRAVDAERLPEMAVGIYDWALLVDHHERRTHLLVRGPDAAARAERLRARLAAPRPALQRPPLRARGPLRSNLDRAAYAAAFRRIHDYLRAGDCYQVNLAQRFEVPVEGDPWEAYCRLRGHNPAPFAAYLDTPYGQVLSASPERFLQVGADGRVETKPIKGTRPRHPDPARDAALAAELAASPKDRAENLMIVDLLRNDIGKNCRVGSVRVPKLFDVESFATVHHLVTTVTGELAPGRDALDLLRGCFPGGSITGAPKLRAMEIIEELEPNRRGIYCGAIGWVGFDGAMDSNIVIRTLVHSEGRMRFWAGGGIVMDSECEAEYQETFDKAAAMLRLFADTNENAGVGG